MSVLNLSKLHTALEVGCRKSHHQYSYTVHNGFLEWEIWKENIKGFKSKAEGSIRLDDDNEVNFTLKGIMDLLKNKELGNG